MTKQEQIEEMAKYICNVCEMGDGFDGKCNGSVPNGYKQCCICLGTAEVIYNAGYRSEATLTYAVQDFAEKLKTKLFAIFGKTICSDLDTEDITDIIDELLKEYE